MKKRMLSWFLCAVMVLTMLPMSVWAEEPEETNEPAETAEITDVIPAEEAAQEEAAQEEAAPEAPAAESEPARDIPVGAPAEFGSNGLSWELDNAGVLTINGEYSYSDMDWYNEDGTGANGGDDLPWKDSRDQIKKVVIGENVYSIGRYAFANCTNLETIEFAGSYFGSIEDYAFTGCTKLASLQVPERCSVKTYAFSGCTGLTDVVLTSYNSIVQYAFQGCTGLNKLVLNAYGCSLNENSFAGCSNLKTIIMKRSATISNSAFDENMDAQIYFPASQFYDYSNYESQDEFPQYGGHLTWNKVEFKVEVDGSYSRSVAPKGSVTMQAKVTAEDPKAVTYQWKRNYTDAQGNYHYDEVIEGANAASYTAENVTARTTYYCYADDGYGNNDYVYWSVYIENNLELERQGDGDVPVEYDKSTTLKAVATATDLSAATYRWTKGYTDAEGYYQNETIEGATGNTYTVEHVTAPATYTCYVNDGYGSNDSVSWDVFVDNGLTLTRVGEEEITVRPKTDVELKATFTAADKTGLKVEWVDSGGNVLATSTDLEAGTTSATVKNVTGSKWINCTITDRFNNEQSVSYQVRVNNDFSAAIVGKEDVCVQPNGSAELKVDVKAFDTEGLTCTWSGGGDKMTLTPSETQPATSCTLSNVTGQGTVECNVRDAYGNSRWLTFYVHVDNNFSLLATSPTELYVEGEKDVTLSVKYTALDKTDLQTEWSIWYGGEGLQLEKNAEDPTVCTVKKVDKPVTVQFYLADRYGNNESVYFEISVDNELEILGETNPNITLEKNGSTTLKVEAIAKDTTGMKYTWDYYTGSESCGTLTPSQSDPSQCTVSNVTESFGVSCEVADRFGNTEYAYYRIYVKADSETPTPTQNDYISVWCLGSSTVYGEKVGDPAKMQVRVYFEPEDMELVYQWYKGSYYGTHQAVEGADTDTLTVNAAETSTQYYCLVHKKGDESLKDYATFTVRVGNNFSVEPEGETRRIVAAGDNVKLKVNATATVTEGLTFKWSVSDSNGSRTLSQATTDTLSVENIRGKATYTCTVSDKYGNRDSAYFYITVDNGLTATAVGSTDVKVSEIGGSTKLEVSVDAKDKTGLTYRWSGSSRFAVIPGDDMLTCQVKDVRYSGNVTFTVTDAYGNTKSVDFTVGVDNTIAAAAEGESVIYVLPGEGTTLKVNATATIPDSLLYRWSVYKPTVGYSEKLTNIADSLKLDEVDANGQYTCTVSDRYGSPEETVTFTVRVNNKFSVSADGETNCFVEEGKSAALKVKATATVTEGMTYEWRKNNKMMPDATTNSLQLDNITYAATYRCIVTDKFGNSANVTFRVGVANDLEVSCDGGNKRFVEKDADATLKVNVTAKNKEGLKYEWRNREDMLDDATTDTWTVKKVTGPDTYWCTVTDQYGNSDTVSFSVGVDNNFFVAAKGEKRRYVALNATATLTVDVTARETDGMTYEWHSNNSSANYEDVKGATLTTKPITAYEEFYCTVTDKYGNTGKALFAVGVENGFTVSTVGSSELFVKPGKTVTVEVKATAAKGALTYQWYEDNTSTYTTARKDVTGPVLTSSPIQGYTEIWCMVTDIYGNSAEAWYGVTPRETVVAEGTYDNGMTWQIEDVDGGMVLSISGEGQVPATQPEAMNEYKAKVDTVKLSQGITGIAANAFTGFTAVKDLYVESYQKDSWANFSATAAGLPAATVNHFWKDVSVKVETGVAATEAAPVTFQLIDSEGNTVSDSTETSKTQSLENVADGTYTMQVAQKGCVTRKVEVEVKQGETAIPTVTLVQVGNLNGKSDAQGNETDATDMQCLFTFLSTNEMEGELADDQEYFQAVADVNSDGITDILDYQALYTMIG